MARETLQSPASPPHNYTSPWHVIVMIKHPRRLLLPTDGQVCGCLPHTIFQKCTRHCENGQGSCTPLSVANTVAYATILRMEATCAAGSSASPASLGATRMPTPAASWPGAHAAPSTGNTSPCPGPAPRSESHPRAPAACPSGGAPQYISPSSAPCTRASGALPAEALQAAGAPVTLHTTSGTPLTALASAPLSAGIDLQASPPLLAPGPGRPAASSAPCGPGAWPSALGCGGCALLAWSTGCRTCSPSPRGSRTVEHAGAQSACATSSLPCAAPRMHKPSGVPHTVASSAVATRWYPRGGMGFITPGSSAAWPGRPAGSVAAGHGRSGCSSSAAGPSPCAVRPQQASASSSASSAATPDASFVPGLRQRRRGHCGRSRSRNTPVMPTARHSCSWRCGSATSIQPPTGAPTACGAGPFLPQARCAAKGALMSAVSCCSAMRIGKLQGQ